MIVDAILQDFIKMGFFPKDVEEDSQWSDNIVGGAELEWKQVWDNLKTWIFQLWINWVCIFFKFNKVMYLLNQVLVVSFQNIDSPKSKLKNKLKDYMMRIGYYLPNCVLCWFSNCCLNVYLRPGSSSRVLIINISNLIALLSIKDLIYHMDNKRLYKSIQIYFPFSSS